MKAVVEDVRSGEVRVLDVPPPELHGGGILVRTSFSAISAGTERAKIEIGEKSLLGKAMARPDLVGKVIDLARDQGINAAYNKVKARLSTLSPLGYSCAGVVLAVGEGITEFQPGDRVACGGAGFANHSEINFIPRNLAVRVPAHVTLAAASLSTIGAVAMQGLRQGDLRFGETVVVIGVGLVGLLSVQLAKIAGCRVAAVDSDPDRTEFALKAGADIALTADDPRIQDIVRGFSTYGVDAALITAASPSSEPVELAARLVRDRGRLVIVGDVRTSVSRQHMYEKELGMVLSRSYGPGRYDPQYEERGIDYPIGYVRWTERRNMEAFISFLDSGSLNVEPLLAHRYAITDAQEAYTEIRKGNIYTGILQYTADDLLQLSSTQTISSQERGKRSHNGKLHIGCIGAGGFARDIIFPHFAHSKDIVLETIATSSGITAVSAKGLFKFARAASASELVSDPEIDAIFILSRHDTHAKYIVDALRNGKLIFVEKPLATTKAELMDVKNTYNSAEERGDCPFVMVGFNRRYAPLTERLKEFFAGRQEPLVAHIRVNAGFIPREHWVHECGGRIVGEFCHFIDWARFVVGSRIKRVSASALPDGVRYTQDNLNAVLVFEDGSIANILYLANGDRAVDKEYFEVFCQGAVARLEDFKKLILSRNGQSEQIRSKRDKGHQKELALTLEAMHSGGPAPIPFSELVEVTETSFAVQEAVGGRGRTLAHNELGTLCLSADSEW